MDGKAVIEEESKIPYQLQASINEPGLGLLSWWNSQHPIKQNILICLFVFNNCLLPPVHTVCYQYYTIDFHDIISLLQRSCLMQYNRSKVFFCSISFWFDLDLVAKVWQTKNQLFSTRPQWQPPMKVRYFCLSFKKLVKILSFPKISYEFEIDFLQAENS